ncbi:GNAT superfamily N-acetyltransferase [Lewinella aquimaris]|uniref:GNAT superfamily N-acetyltransferase n=1 Tax=Neolewinella aquimaris TaxID=1835722 RepID=A0A840E7Z4_9BACT|nr:GNAT family N-acetyltransferase [Neolewinella aquimaris]MBB4078188.1 GNAT superfamily N-acetyltransferase [Neolewinella aquimaris]
MIDLVLPTPEELRALLRNRKHFRGFEIVQEALPPRVILDQSRYFPTSTPLTYRWAVPHLIVLGEEDRVVGSIGGKGLLPGEEEVELGYNVAPAYRGRGIMKQAIHLVMEMAKGDGLGLIAHVAPSNLPSRAVLTANGFSHDATVSWPVGFALERWRWPSPDQHGPPLE